MNTSVIRSTSSGLFPIPILSRSLLHPKWDMHDNGLVHCFVCHPSQALPISSYWSNNISIYYILNPRFSSYPYPPHITNFCNLRYHTCYHQWYSCVKLSLFLPPAHYLTNPPPTSYHTGPTVLANISKTGGSWAVFVYHLPRSIIPLTHIGLMQSWTWLGIWLLPM